jgi:hypothetical protein
MVIYKLNKLQKKLRGQPLKKPYVPRFAELLEKKPILRDTPQFPINDLWRYFFLISPDPIRDFFFRFGICLYERVFPGSIAGYFREILATMILLYIPQIIVFSVYLYEIFIYKQFEGFSYCAVILLIPLIFLGLRKILMTVSFFELTRIQQHYFKIVYKNNEEYNFRKAIESDLSGEPYFPGENFEFIERDNKISKKVYRQIFNAYSELWEIQRMAIKFYKTSEKYDDIASLLINIILMLSFFLWLLIIFGII